MTNQPIDIYCERLDASFWAEPVNALTNFAFILAAIFAFSRWRQTGGGNYDILALVILTALVGIGSFLFHTYATRETMLADIIPIIIFIFSATGVIFKRICGLKTWQAVSGVVLFALASFALIKICGREMFNGSIQYVPALALLFGVAIYSQARKSKAARPMFIASVMFLISITFRSIDDISCETFPLGTHFLWHMLNAATMYYVVKSLVRVSKN